MENFSYPIVVRNFIGTGDITEYFDKNNENGFNLWYHRNKCIKLSDFLAALDARKMLRVHHKGKAG